MHCQEEVQHPLEHKVATQCLPLRPWDSPELRDVFRTWPCRIPFGAPNGEDRRIGFPYSVADIA